MKICKVCGKEYDRGYKELCRSCYDKMHSRPKGVYTDLTRHEQDIKNEWEERARKKNDRIIGAGYAERQIAQTLAMVSKIKKEL